MRYLTKSYLEDLTIRLCAVPSVSGNAQEENRCASLIYDEVSAAGAVAGERFYAEMTDCTHDPLNRKAVLAFLRAPNKTARTVLLTGHFDVVDTQVCGDLSEAAFDLKTYGEKLAGRELAEDIRKDLEGGDWLFGRGSMDMKAGIALFIAAIREYASDVDLNVNLMLLAVPDEEANSAGMRGAVPRFAEFVRSEKLDVIAALTGEPCFWTAPSEKSAAYRPYYTGTTGKIMPVFLALGSEAHIGCYYEGMSAALMMAKIIDKVEGNPELIAGEGRDVLTPPACLSMQVRRSVYSVTLPERAAAYFNVLTIEKTPADVLQWCIKAAAEAAKAVTEQLAMSREAFAAKGGSAPEVKKVSVHSVFEVREKAVLKVGGAEKLREEEAAFIAAQPKDTDARELSLRALEFLVTKAELTGPAYIVGFVPPYYPARLNTRKNDKEKALRRVIEETVEEASVLIGDNAFGLTEVFGGITDLSFLGFDGSRSDLEALSDNMPAWGAAYWLPMDELLAMDVPVANMAGAGRDAHKMTERLECRYSFEVAPKLLARAVEKLSDPDYR